MSPCYYYHHYIIIRSFISLLILYHPADKSVYQEDFLHMIYAMQLPLQHHHCKKIYLICPVMKYPG